MYFFVFFCYEREKKFTNCITFKTGILSFLNVKPFLVSKRNHSEITSLLLPLLLLQGVDFINVFSRAFFCMNVLFGSFSSYVLALAPKFVQKCMKKMLMKMMQGVNFRNVLRIRFCTKAFFLVKF